MHKNYWFVGIQFVIVGGQVLIMFIGGQAFSVHRINGPQWGYSLILGILSIPFAVVIRCFPDELFAKLIPTLPRRHRAGPELVVQDDEAGITQWNPALVDIREELSFLKKLRGGRMAELAFKLQHPRQSFMPRSPSKSYSKTDLPDDDPEKIVANAYAAANAEAEAKKRASTPEKKKRSRGGSSSVFGPAAAMAGIVAGSIGGGWSPVERRPEDSQSVTFQRSRAPSGVEGTSGIEIHPATSTEDQVFAPDKVPDTRIPPSQNPSLAPHFDHAPPHSPAPSFGRRSHSRHSSAAPKEG